jgi:hypothetical protein
VCLHDTSLFPLQADLESVSWPAPFTAHILPELHPAPYSSHHRNEACSICTIPNTASAFCFDGVEYTLHTFTDSVQPKPIYTQSLSVAECIRMVVLKTVQCCCVAQLFRFTLSQSHSQSLSAAGRTVIQFQISQPRSRSAV